jgi:Uma2 family endonuclease
MDEVLVLPKLQMRNTWTVEDLRALDLEDWRRYELVDGSLVVSPSASRGHERVSAEVRAALWNASPAELLVSGPIGVELGRSYRIPDLVVTARSVMNGPGDLDPGEILLVVEVVSPGSETTDRVTKAAQYAAAGIAHYWRVETDPVSLTAYRLASSVYAEDGTWTAGQTAQLAEPFAVELDLNRLLPG